MKDELYLKKAKLKLNKDLNQNVIFDEYQNGPMEEPNLIEFDVNIEKFKKYQMKIKELRK
jgi:hypothetical protein